MKKLVLSSLLVAFTFLSYSYAQTSLAEGIKFLNNENYGEAQKFFESVVKKEPTNAVANYYMGEVKYALEDYAGAKDAYSAGAKISSKCAECTIGLAKLSLDNGNAAEATKSLDAVEKSNKKSAAVLALIGNAYLRSKKPNATKALEMLTKSRDLDPKVATTLAHMGDAAKLAGDLGTAMSSYESSVKKDPNNIEAYMSMARIWASSRQQDLAIEKLESAIKLSPDYAPAYKLMYELYYKANQFKKMVPILEKYVSLAGSDLEAKIRLVKFLCYEVKDYDRTILEAQKLLGDSTLKLSNKDVMTLNRFLSWAAAETGKSQESYDAGKIMFKIAEQDTARKMYPSDYNYFAQSAMKLGKMEDALMAYEVLFKEDPSRKEEVYGSIAKKYYDDKNYTEAITYFLKKGEAKPLNTTDNFYLGQAYFQTKKYTESDAIFAKLLETTPSYLTGWSMRARIAKLLDPDGTKLAAQPFYQKYVEYAAADPKSIENKQTAKTMVDAYNYLGVCASKSNDVVSAKSLWEKAIAIDPVNEDALGYLKIVNGGK